jgi:anaerobic selenocysteine-containing dehydrogenase
MPGHDDSSPPAGLTNDDLQDQQHLSRRSVLRGAAGAGVAGIAATALAGPAMPAFAAAATRPAGRGTKADRADADTSEQLVVHVRDARSGEIDVFRGTSHARVHDPELAARLMRASR